MTNRGRISEAEVERIAEDLRNGMWDESPIPTTPEMKAESSAMWDRMQARLRSKAAEAAGDRLDET